MFGAFRFFLASLVVINHAGVVYGGVNPGPIAVVGFYIISGFVISYLIDHRISAGLFKAFYSERFFRIYPQFLFHLILAVVLVSATAHVSQFSEVRPGLQSMALNLTLFPLQFRAFSDYITGSLYVPVSWSLSLEASFYLAAPLLMRSRLLDIAAAASFSIFLLAVLGLLAEQPHTFSYATIFGTLHFFAVGAWLQRGQLAKVRLWGVAMIIVAILITFLASWRPPHVQEVILGGILGIVVISYLRGVKPGKFEGIDTFLGRISYPVFLNHFLFIWAFELAGWDEKTPVTQTSILLCSWLFGAVAFYLVERPLDAYRRGLRAG